MQYLLRRMGSSRAHGRAFNGRVFTGHELGRWRGFAISTENAGESASITTKSAGIGYMWSPDGLKLRPETRSLDVSKPLEMPSVFTPPSVAKMWHVGPHKPAPEAWVRDFVTDTRTGLVSLPRYLFDASPRMDLIHRASEWQRAAMRAGTAKTKTRAEVHGTTRKMSPQKGMGSARHGDRKAPIFVGGGRVWGPKPKDWSYSLPRNINRKALSAALTIKYIQGHVEVVENMEIDEGSTRLVTEILQERGWKSAFFVDTKINNNLTFACRNVPSIVCERAEYLNVRDIMKFEKLVMTTDVIDYLVEQFESVNSDWSNVEKRVISRRPPTEQPDPNAIPNLVFKGSKVNIHAWYYRHGTHRRTRTGDFYTTSRTGPKKNTRKK